MDKQRLSEWFLAQQCGRQRASEIVGDLYEQYGGSWLAMRVLTTALIMSRRMIGAVILTAVLIVSPGLWRWGGWVLPAIQTLHLFGLNEGARIWYPLLELMSTLSWGLTFLCGMRYGLSDRMTRIGLVLAVLLSIDTLFAFKPQLRLAIACLIVTSALVLLVRRQTATATLGLVLVAGAEYGVLRVIGAASQPLFDSWAMHHHFLPTLVYNHKFETLWYSIQIIQWIVCAAMATWMLNAVRQRIDLAVEGS